MYSQADGGFPVIMEETALVRGTSRSMMVFRSVAMGLKSCRVQRHDMGLIQEAVKDMLGFNP